MQNQRHSSSSNDKNPSLIQCQDQDHHMTTEQLHDPLISGARHSTDFQNEAHVAEDLCNSGNTSSRTAATASFDQSSTKGPDPGLRRPSPVETLDFDEPYNSLHDEELLDTSPGTRCQVNQCQLQ